MVHANQSFEGRAAPASALLKHQTQSSFWRSSECEYLLISFPCLCIISLLRLCLNKVLIKYLLWVFSVEILIIPKCSCIWKCDVNTWKFWWLINKLTSTFVYLYVHFDKKKRIWTMNGEKVGIFWLIWEKCSHLLLKHVLFTFKNFQSPYLGKSKS